MKRFRRVVLALDVAALLLLAVAVYCLVTESKGLQVHVAGRKILSITKFTRPYFAFLGVAVARIVVTIAWAPEEFRARYRTGRGRLKPRLAALVGSLLVVLTGLEVGYRIWNPYEAPPTLINDGALWKVKNVDFHPNADGILSGVHCYTDEYGFRCRPARPVPSPGARRVLVLGDSFAFGTGVEVEDTIPLVAEERLRAAGHDVFFYNAAVPGMRTRDEYGALERGLVARPDVVLLIWCMNDVMPEATRWSPLVARLASRIHSFGFMCQRLTDDPDRNNIPWVLRCYGEENPYWAEAREYLGKMRDLGREKGFEFRVAVFPHLEKLDEDPFEPAHRALDGLLESEGIVYRDWRQTFAGMKEDELWVHPTDHHPNARADRIAGEDLAEFLAPALAP